MALTASEAAFEGFRLTREKPLLAAGLGLIHLAAALVLIAIYTGPFAADMPVIEAAILNPPKDPTTLPPGIDKVAALTVLLIPILILSSALMSAAVFRAVLRPDQKGVAGFRLGVDEIRLLVLYAGLFAGGLAAAAVFFVAASLLGGVVLLAVPAASTLMVALVMVGLMVGALAIGIRASLAGPASFDTRALRLAGPWILTRGRFWPLFGTYLMTVVLVLIVAMLGEAIMAGVLWAVEGGVIPKTPPRPDYSSFAAYMTPVMIAYTVGNSAISGLCSLILFAAPAVVWRELRSGTVERVV